jgi:hypothetical protein
MEAPHFRRGQDCHRVDKGGTAGQNENASLHV